jgi:hypothetical protein
MIRRIDYLIEQSRQSTENTQYTETAGVQNSEFLQYMNDAQTEIHAIINNTFPLVLMKDTEISVSSGQEAYSVPRDLYLGTRIDFVEYSPSGLARDYYPIKKGSTKERLNGQPNNPSFYIRRGEQILLQPAPQGGGKLRIGYQYAIPRLAFRNAQVLSVTLTGTTITALTFNTAVNLDAEELLKDGFVTVVDKNGAVNMRSIPITNINTTTGVVTIDPGFQFEAGETIEVGNYVCRGEFSSPTSQLPDISERFLLEYCNMRILMRDSNSDQQAIGAIMAKCQDTITKAFSEPDSDGTFVTVLDPQYLGWDSY